MKNFDHHCVSNYEPNSSKSLHLILLSEESICIADYFSRVYFMFYDNSYFHAWDIFSALLSTDRTKQKKICRHCLRRTYISIGVAV